VSGRRVFTPTNYDSRCRYAPFQKTLVRHNEEKLAQRIANRSSVHRGWKNRADLPRRKRVEYGPLKTNPCRLLARRNGGTFARSPLPHRVRQRILTVCRRKVITNADRSRSLLRRWVTKSRVLMQTRGGQGRNSLIIGRLWLIRGHFASVSARRIASESFNIYQHPVDIRRGTRGQRIPGAGSGCGEKKLIEKYRRREGVSRDQGKKWNGHQRAKVTPLGLKLRLEC